jgi:hypothetical protein
MPHTEPSAVGHMEERPETPTLQKLYGRAHRLVIVDLKTTVAAIENKLAVHECDPVAGGTEDGADGVSGMIRRAAQQIRDRIAEYQRQFDRVMQCNDTRTMRGFLERTRALYACNPDFSFIPEVLPQH